jgi:hypothetical protein
LANLALPHAANNAEAAALVSIYTDTVPPECREPNPQRLNQRQVVELHALKPDIVVVKRERVDGVREPVVKSVLVLEVTVANPLNEPFSVVKPFAGLDRAAEKKTAKYRLLVESMQRWLCESRRSALTEAGVAFVNSNNRGGGRQQQPLPLVTDSVEVKFVPLVVASLGFTPPTTVQSLSSLCDKEFVSVDRVCCKILVSVTQSNYEMFRARCAMASAAAGDDLGGGGRRGIVGDRS